MPRQRRRNPEFEQRVRTVVDVIGRPGVAGLSRLGGAGGFVGGLPGSVVESSSETASTGDAQLLVMSASGDSIASGGDYVAFDANVAQIGFGGALIASAGWGHPISGVYTLTVTFGWDTYELGGTVALELDGVVPEGCVIGAGSAGTNGRGTISYFATAGQTGRIKVTQSSGSAQTCDATVFVAITDPYTGTDPDIWTKVYTGDVWGLAWDGSGWWTTNGVSTVTRHAADFSVISSFTAMTRTRGITWDGSSIWVAGEQSSEVIRNYSTAGATLSTFATGPSSDGNAGLAWDGSKLWLVENSGDDAERWTTAGVNDASFALPGGKNQYGATWFNGELYIVNSTDGIIWVYDTAGTLLRSIDTSGAATDLTGVYIMSDGTLYVSKDGDGVWRRDRKVSS